MSYVLSGAARPNNSTCISTKHSIPIINRQISKICDRACENRACGLLKLALFQSLSSHNFLFQYGLATKFSRFVDNLFGFTTLLTESKYYILVLRHVESNNMVYFSPHALFSQARSHIIFYSAHKT